MNLEVVCSALPCLLSGPIDGASPLWNQGVITRTTHAREEPQCKHCRARSCCPVIATRWINSMAFSVGVERRVSPWKGVVNLLRLLPSPDKRVIHPRPSCLLSSHLRTRDFTPNLASFL